MYNENMGRPYTLKRRAEQQAETRQRIVEAAVELHGSLGPARTSLSQVAELAGVQRNTLYAHFPDERSLLMACSAYSLECDPLPSAEPWQRVRGRERRLSAGLAEIYAWYGRNAELAGCVLRDAESHPLVREIVGLRYAPVFSSYERVLGEGATTKQQAMLRLALDYSCWRTLVRDGALKPRDAAESMARAVVSA